MESKKEFSATVIIKLFLLGPTKIFLNMFHIVDYVGVAVAEIKIYKKYIRK